MTPRWLPPICALLALGFVSPAIDAKDSDYEVQFSTSPEKVVGNIPNLSVRPNTASKFYLFVTNNSGNDRDAIIQLTDGTGKTVYAESKLKLAEKTPIRIGFAKPPAPMPPAGAAPPAAAPPPMPMPKTPPPPPGVEMNLTRIDQTQNPYFAFRVRIFDDRSKDQVSKDTEYAVIIPQPYTYVKPVGGSPTYVKKGNSNQLTVMMSATDLSGTAPCPVELSFPPQPGLKVDALREGVYKRVLTADQNSVRLYASNLPLIGGVGANGYVYVSIDGVPRSYVFRPNLATDTGAQKGLVDRQTDPAIRFLEAVKIQTAETTYVRPGIIPIRVEVDAPKSGATIRLEMRRTSEQEIVQSVTRDTIRDSRAWFEPAAPDGSMLVSTTVGDWVIPLDVRDYRGQYELKAILVNPADRNNSYAEFSGKFVVDDTKPEEVSVVALPDRSANEDPPRHIRTLPLPVKVIANDPESKIVKVVVFLGKPMPDGKLPEGAVEATQPDAKRSPSTWVAQVPLPMGAKGIQEVTAVATNAVGLSEVGAQKIQLLDPPTGGTIRGTVSLRPKGKALAGVPLVLKDSEGKDKGTATTKADGIFEMKDVPPGTYKLFAARPDSGVGTRALETVTVKAGETTTVRMVLNRMP